MTSNDTVAVLGLGPMGRALATALLAAGKSTVVWSRTPRRLDGAVVAGDPTDAVRRAGLVVTCVVNHEALLPILESVPDWSGAALLDLTTGTPAEARALAGWAADRGIDFLDGAILSETVTIGTTAATILYSGPEPVFAAHRDTLAGFGGAPLHLGADPGRAAAHDMALLDLFGMSVGGVAHAFALATAEGIDPRAFARFATGIGTMLPGLIERFAGALADGSFPGGRSTVGSAVSGLTRVIAAADAHGLDSAALRAVRAVADRAVADGHGEDGLARLAVTLRQSR